MNTRHERVSYQGVVKSPLGHKITVLTCGFATYHDHAAAFVQVRSVGVQLAFRHNPSSVGLALAPHVVRETGSRSFSGAGTKAQ